MTQFQVDWTVHQSADGGDDRRPCRTQRPVATGSVVKESTSADELHRTLTRALEATYPPQVDGPTSTVERVYDITIRPL